MMRRTVTGKEKKTEKREERIRGAAQDANKRSSASNFFATSLAVFSPLPAEKARRKGAPSRE